MNALGIHKQTRVNQGLEKLSLRTGINIKSHFSQRQLQNFGVFQVLVSDDDRQSCELKIKFARDKTFRKISVMRVLLIIDRLVQLLLLRRRQSLFQLFDSL